jgi:hypothetical protein
MASRTCGRTRHRSACCRSQSRRAGEDRACRKRHQRRPCTTAAADQAVGAACRCGRAHARGSLGAASASASTSAQQVLWSLISTTAASASLCSCSLTQMNGDRGPGRITAPMLTLVSGVQIVELMRLAVHVGTEFWDRLRTGMFQPDGRNRRRSRSCAVWHLESDDAGACPADPASI